MSEIFFICFISRFACFNNCIWVHNNYIFNMLFRGITTTKIPYISVTSLDSIYFRKISTQIFAHKLRTDFEIVDERQRLYAKIQIDKLRTGTTYMYVIANPNDLKLLLDNCFYYTCNHSYHCCDHFRSSDVNVVNHTEQVHRPVHRQLFCCVISGDKDTATRRTITVKHHKP